MGNFTKGEWEFNRFDLTIRVKEWRKAQTMGDYRGCIIADLKPAIGADNAQDLESIETSKKVHPEGWLQTEANAYIIAAAPKMYEHLLRVIEWMEMNHFDTGVVGQPLHESIIKLLSEAEDK